MPSGQNRQQRIDATAQRDTNRQAWQLDECAIGSSVRVTKTRDGLSLTLRPSDADVNSVGKGWKMAQSNGRWQVPDESGKRDDPDRDFPIRQAFTDYTGQARHFVISYFRANLGFGVQAEEEGKDGEGYFFREFDPNSPYLALGRIRGRIRTALATRHIEQQEPGDFQATHQTVRGRISYADFLCCRRSWICHRWTIPHLATVWQDGRDVRGMGVSPRHSRLIQAPCVTRAWPTSSYPRTKATRKRMTHRQLSSSPHTSSFQVVDQFN